MVDKTLHRKLKIEKHEPTLKFKGENSCASEVMQILLHLWDLLITIFSLIHQMTTCH